MKTIGVIGTRRKDGYDDFYRVCEKFYEIYKVGDTICSGLCPKGADRFAVIIQKEENIPYLWFPADWKKYGKKAGFERNIDIAICSDVLIAMVADDRTGGTEDTINKFIEHHGKQDLYIIY
jgi:hypothetical protein